MCPVTYLGRTGVSPANSTIKDEGQDRHPACPRITGKMPVPSHESGQSNEPMREAAKASRY